LIIRLPEENRTRFKQVAKARKVSVTKLIEEMATILWADIDAETRFELRATHGRGRIAEARVAGQSGGETSSREAHFKMWCERGTLTLDLGAMSAVRQNLV